MAGFNAQKHWWIVIAAVAVLGVAALQITEKWLPGNTLVGASLFFALIGAGFCWVYTVNRDRLWWAVIPGILCLAVLPAILADQWIGTDPKNDWIGVLILGCGALLTAAALRRPDARLVLIFVAMITILVGIAMGPFTPALKVVLIAADVLGFGLFAWRKSTALIKTS